MKSTVLHRAALLASILIGTCGSAFANEVAPGCGSLHGGRDASYGPYDYNNPEHFAERLPVVESAHFDTGVETLRGHASHPQNLGGDIDYTLRAFPNHPRALYSMIQYQITAKDYKRPRMRYTAECYFKRAMAFAPTDGKVRQLYGLYLYKTGNIEAAITKFNEALTLTPDSAEAHYNLGLMLAKNGQYDQAREHAEQAYNLGYQLPGLRNKLKRVGAW